MKFKARVTDTIKPFANLIIHRAVIERGVVWVGDKIEMEVDEKFRMNVLVHHTSTHILHAILKEILGSHVNQAGSLVAPDKLRFDFSHYSAIDQKEIAIIGEIANERIRDRKSVV